MNKKVDEEFIGIKDVYALQCLATELKRNNVNEILKSDYDLCCKELRKTTKKLEKQDKEIERLNNIINEVLDYLRKNNFVDINGFTILNIVTEKREYY